MSRFIIFLLTLGILVSFFIGLRLGKTIQKIDTPVRVEYKMREKMVVVTATPSPTRIPVK